MNKEEKITLKNKLITLRKYVVFISFGLLMGLTVKMAMSNNLTSDSSTLLCWGIILGMIGFCTGWIVCPVGYFNTVRKEVRRKDGKEKSK